MSSLHSCVVVVAQALLHSHVDSPFARNWGQGMQRSARATYLWVWMGSHSRKKGRGLLFPIACVCVPHSRTNLGAGAKKGEGVLSHRLNQCINGGGEV